MRDTSGLEVKKEYWSDRVQPKLDLITGWARNGATDEQIYTNLGIGQTTWYKYLKEKPELGEALRVGREDAEVLVENALFKRAVGFTYKEKTRERVRVFDEDGKWTGEYKYVTTKTVIKHQVPDVEAQKYWLEHRAPKRWERTPMSIPDTDGINKGIMGLADLLRHPVQERQIGDEEA